MTTIRILKARTAVPVLLAVLATVVLADDVAPRARSSYLPPTDFSNPYDADYPVLPAAQAMRERGGPVLISLKANGEPLEKVVASLSEQTGMPISWAPGSQAAAKMAVTVDLKEVPFWVGLQQILGPVGGGIDLAFWPSQLRVVQDASLFPLSTTVSAGSVAGGVDAKRLPAVPKSKAAAGANDRPPAEVALKVRVAFDPSLLAQPAVSRWTFRGGEDDAGNKLKLASYRGQTDNLHWNRIDHSFGLASFSVAAKSIKFIRGSVRTLAWGGYEEWMIEDVTTMKPQEKVLGGVTYRVETLKKEGNIYAVYASAKESHPDYSSVNPVNVPRMALINKEGKQISDLGSPDHKNFRDEHKFRARFEVTQGEPARFIWRIPYSPRQVEVPFEVRDVPLSAG